jgi:hypothetical protein
MFDKKDRMITPSKGGGIFYGLANRIKLVFRLIADRRVNPWLKLLPIGSVIYLIAPDLMPGPIDDAAVIWLGAYLFVELCPPEVVHEHMKSLNLVSDEKPDEINDDDIVDAEYWEEKKIP